ncbi:glycosyltransferase [Palaeococcus ferrophilus]|uniref:glycosyltransferase n=1 Tax=Palaeococcus ferrophilus TaxID=83868 RepID=UPI00064F66D3|nr:glycosyltransferase [Palaeococcus ferrophilus]
MDIRLVVFDLDGTLIGAPKPFQEIKEELRQRLISLGISEERVGDLTPMYENLERIAKETGRSFDELHRILIDLEVERMEESYPFDGARELLSFLKENGVKVALMTRSPREAALKALEMHGLMRFFDLVSARDDVPIEDVKPNEGQLRAIMEEFSVPASKTVVVGDHGYDVIPANRVGALSVMITGHESGRMSFQIAERPTFEVNDLIQARELLRRLLNAYVVVPAYNEERTIGGVLDSLLEYFRPEEVIVVNDGSRDRTEEIARSKGVRVVRHLINRGLGGALGTGIKYALLRGAELIVTFDADGQHLVSDALRVMAPVAEGRADFAVGSRLKGDVSEMPFVKRFGNFVLDSITALFAARYVSDSQSGLRCFNRECASKVRITCDRYAVSSEIIIEVSKAKCRIIEVPIKAVYTEYAMKKGTNVLEGIKIALNLMLDKLR